FNTDIFFTYTTGLTLSFEKLYRGARTYLLPTFGVQAGGIYFNEPAGNGLLLMPSIGLVLVAGPSFSLAVDGRFYLNTF
ncbi:hypothetical protein M3M33_16990, partial [Loigolactobacillus coryniformis]|uniref:hypothetical protein n=1 Tax=Loigolactobacillus coryniformis TaxID=1610 RepID=UPI00201A76C7